jgi:hypothetical protein
MKRGTVPMTIRYGTSTHTEAEPADLIHGGRMSAKAVRLLAVPVCPKVADHPAVEQ